MLGGAVNTIFAALTSSWGGDRCVNIGIDHAIKISELTLPKSSLVTPEAG